MEKPINDTWKEQSLTSQFHSFKAKLITHFPTVGARIQASTKTFVKKLGTSGPSDSLDVLYCVGLGREQDAAVSR